MNMLINILLTILWFTRISTTVDSSALEAKIFTIYTPNGTIINSTLNPSGFHVRHIVVIVTSTDHHNFTLDLHLNGHLFSPDYREKVCSEKGDYYLNFNNLSDHCYYVGNVRGYDGSIASISTCGKITGFFIVGQKSYSIVEYLKGPVSYAVVKEETFENWTCGVLNSLTKDFHSRSKRALNDKLDRVARFIEQYVVSDASHLRLFKSESEASLRIKNVVNAANALFNTIDYFLVLVGLEIWTVSKIVVDSNNPGKTLDNFFDYKNTTLNGNSPSHDNACIFLGVLFPNKVIGLAQYEAMCHSMYSGSFISDRYDEGFTVGSSGALLTHEIGHNLGISHDPNDGSCYCDDPKGKCIMNPSTSSQSGPTTFSSCSKSEMVSKRAKGVDMCLFNVPTTMSTIFDAAPFCGNGVIENGEDCDCGKLPEYLCNKDCCDSVTCKLKGSVGCAMGECCDISTCQIIGAYTICRPSQGPCDINELCIGNSPFCPADVFRHDGSPCSVDDSPACCYKGMCKNHKSQCKYVWGTDANAAQDACYSGFNKEGNYSGSCQIILNPVPSFVPCDDSNVMCGQLFCETSRKIPVIRYESITYSYSTVVCYAGFFDFGKQVLTPGYVPNGAVCGNSKMCINQKCVDVSSVVNTTPCSSQCSGGVCNSEGQCQCENGVKYPDCSLTVFTKPPTTTTIRPYRDSSSVIKLQTLLKLIVFFNLIIILFI